MNGNKWKVKWKGKVGGKYCACSVILYIYLQLLIIIIQNNKSTKINYFKLIYLINN